MPTHTATAARASRSSPVGPGASPPPPPLPPPNRCILIGAIDGARTALAVISPARGSRLPLATRTYPSRGHRDLESLVWTFLRDKGLDVGAAVLALPVPVGDDGCTPPSPELPWRVDRRRLQNVLELPAVTLCQDVHATAAAIPHLRDDELATLCDGDRAAARRRAVALLTVGHGLGEAFLVRDGRRYRAVPAPEPPRPFAPRSSVQRELRAWLQRRRPHAGVEWQHVCCGRAVPDLYAFLKQRARFDEPPSLALALASAADPTAVIVADALEGGRAEISRATVTLLVELLGGRVREVALSPSAAGGVYLGGDLAPRLLPLLHACGFLRPLRATRGAGGADAERLARVPIRVIDTARALLLGLAHLALEPESTVAAGAITATPAAIVAAPSAPSAPAAAAAALAAAPAAAG